MLTIAVCLTDSFGVFSVRDNVELMLLLKLFGYAAGCTELLCFHRMEIVIVYLVNCSSV